MILTFLTGFALGALAFWIFLEVLALRVKRRGVTKHARRGEVHRRQYRDRPIPEVATDWDAVDRGVNYTFMGQTGIEE